jgi:hypothetical protein
VTCRCERRSQGRQAKSPFLLLRHNALSFNNVIAYYLNDCGARSDWYAYVFVGSISARTPAGNDEEILQITPEELFYGNPSTPLTVLTSQGACLPTLAVGNRWLFYLRKENGKPIVLDYYGNDSRPVESAQEEIETLRQLKGIGKSGSYAEA